MREVAHRAVSRRALLTAAAGATLAAVPAGRVVRADDTWPSRPVKLVVPFAPGGAVDIVSRLTARYLSDELQQQVYVENRSGAGGSLGAEFVAKAPADGYTLLMQTVSSAVIVALTYTNLRFDPRRDLVPISQIAAAPTLVVISAKVPATTLRQFVDLVRSSPGQYKFGSTGTGGSIHLAGRLFATRNGLDMVHVPYQGEAEAIKDLVAGETHMETGVASAFLPFIRAAQLRALCVNGSGRISLLPDVPTAAEAGLPDFDLPNWYALFAPRGVPERITRRLYQYAVRILALRAVRERLAELGLDSVGSSPREMADYLDRQFEFWTPVVEASGVKPTR